MSIQDGDCLGVLGAEVVSGGTPLANIGVEGPPGFRFVFFTGLVYFVFFFLFV